MPYERREGGETAADDAAGYFSHAIIEMDVLAFRVLIAAKKSSGWVSDRSANFGTEKGLVVGNVVV